jgi:tRNA A37 methylthiotransferase MiaB
VQSYRQKEKADETLVRGCIAEDESRKRKLSEVEVALRKSEMSRRRKNQLEKKLEDEKIEVRLFSLSRSSSFVALPPPPFPHFCFPFLACSCATSLACLTALY